MVTASTGRPRDPDLERRVLDAALEVYGKLGWAKSSIDAVAKAAGVGKASIYLRWSTKEELLKDALQGISHLEEVTAADFRAGLIEMVKHNLRNYSGPTGLAAMRIPVEAAEIPAVHEQWERLKISQTRAARRLVRGAVRSGDLPPETSVNLLLESLFGAALMHVQVSSVEDRSEIGESAHGYAEQIVDFVLSAVDGRSRE
ncbi:MAG: TetR family transcriptional regulator [Gordonia sp.]|nr:TetR family transcriptional regulator [Gordonia sp. (in: high G+C Gram-positive bacteria)]